MFSIFRQSNNSFEGQLPDEKALIVLKAHWFTVVNRMAAILVLALMPFVAYGLGRSFLVSWGVSALYWLVIAIYLMFLWMKLFYEIFLYLLNVWIVTDHRIIDSEQLGFFNRSLSELNIANVQDVTVNIKGFFQTTMNFGDIEVQTAAEEEKFLFKSVPFPLAAKDTIMQAHDNFLSSHINSREVIV